MSMQAVAKHFVVAIGRRLLRLRNGVRSSPWSWEPVSPVAAVAATQTRVSTSRTMVAIRCASHLVLFHAAACCCDELQASLTPRAIIASALYTAGLMLGIELLASVSRPYSIITQQ